MEPLKDNGVYPTQVSQTSQRNLSSSKDRGQIQNMHQVEVSRETDKTVISLCVSLSPEVPKNDLISLDGSADQNFRPNSTKRWKSNIFRHQVNLLEPNVHLGGKS